jgi:hypothetical protein
MVLALRAQARGRIRRLLVMYDSSTDKACPFAE